MQESRTRHSGRILVGYLDDSASSGLMKQLCNYQVDHFGMSSSRFRECTIQEQDKANGLKRRMQRSRGKYAPNSVFASTDLERAYEIHPGMWTKIASIIERTEQDCRDRYNKEIANNDNRNIGQSALLHPQPVLIDRNLECARRSPIA